MDHIDWVLERIQKLTERLKDTPMHWPTHRNIWRGSYDVWFTEQDKIDAKEIHLQNMKQAEDLGLIVKETKQYPGGTHEVEVWSLTPLGLSRLNQSVDPSPTPIILV